MNILTPPFTREKAKAAEEESWNCKNPEK